MVLYPVFRSGMARCASGTGKIAKALRVLMALTLLSTAVAPSGASAQQVTAMMQSIAEAASKSKDLSAYYRATGYKPVFADNSARAKSRRAALVKALRDAPAHGLAPYDTSLLEANLRSIKSERDLGRAEVQMAQLFLDYARDMQTGQLIPSRIDSGIVRQVPYRDGVSLLTNFTKSNPAAYLRKLMPSSPEYARLLKEKAKLEKTLGAGGWGQKVPSGKYQPGSTGNGVVILRNRLIAMGYLPRSAAASYDGAMQKAVQQFQLRHGLAADGVAGPGTIQEINVEPAERLASILVALERERWTNMPRGKRHIWVNITDYTAKVIDNDKVTFQTRSVVGATRGDRRTPEFSDVMEHMVINPTWNVPRSITTKEYLPLMQKNPNAAGHLRIVDSRGRTVPRSAINFASYTAKTFPYAMKQPPSDGNALGLVKFMFPNKYNIYLHDTPSKSLFGRETRAFSHGCIRLADPFDFAYTLLSKQTNDPKGLFHSHLKTGRESVVPLETQVPVHIVYRTAFAQPKGGMEYRRDVYGRDAKIWNALQKQGVQLRAVGG
ncbi:L,D-transpeptidase family protein [Celeribacter sp.]|uniref:L,D-transpeptidase family protein n=1 Tax=Celeribacter sp. TaxID=1890673 RepID=UPI003A8EF326